MGSLRMQRVDAEVLLHMWRNGAESSLRMWRCGAEVLIDLSGYAASYTILNGYMRGYFIAEVLLSGAHTS